MKYLISRRDFSEAIKVPLNELTYVLYVRGTDSYYDSFTIEKRNGGLREIDASHGSLKYIQNQLLKYLWRWQQEIWKEKEIKPNIAHAFQKRKSIITNANVHKNKRIVCNYDLEDFFPSIHFGGVKGFFEKNKEFRVSKEVATIIAQIACYKGRLPQGSPCSPIISNLICNIMDIRILKLAKKYKLDYTRYADDLTFSTNNRVFLGEKGNFDEELKRMIEKAGFFVNERKIQTYYRSSQQIVTGLVVNKKVAVDREYYKKTRAMAFSLYKEGEFYINGEKGTIEQLEGRFSFINQTDWFNRKIGLIEKTTSREKQYKLFLIYKYFFNNEQPIVLTEGKTDVLYIKSAIIALEKKYGGLIKKNDANRIQFCFSFFRRTKRIEHFFNMSMYGGDAISLIITLYKDKGKQVDREKTPIEWIKKVSGRKPKVPIIIVFDNEHDDNSPLSKAIGIIRKNIKKHCGTEKEKILNEIDSTGMFHIKDNLYLVSLPKEKKSKDIEIEDLFDEDWLKHLKIRGKTYISKFEKNEEFDNEKNYSKNDLSKYAKMHYSEINFEQFEPLLNVLQSIIK